MEDHGSHHGVIGFRGNSFIENAMFNRKVLNYQMVVSQMKISSRQNIRVSDEDETE